MMFGSKSSRHLLIDSVCVVDNKEKSLGDILKDESLLREWVHLSLDDRCAMIKEQFGIQLTRYTLANIYH